jgi:hypothetical protein
MSKINPLYLLGFFLFVAVLMIYKTGSTQEKINDLTASNVQIEADGKQIQLLKERWKDSKRMQKRIESILSHHTFKNNVIKKEKKKNRYIFQLHELDQRTLDAFTNKILNEPIIVKKMEIERFSDSNASISLECSL